MVSVLLLIIVLSLCSFIYYKIGQGIEIRELECNFNSLKEEYEILCLHCSKLSDEVCRLTTENYKIRNREVEAIN